MPTGSISERIRLPATSGAPGSARRKVAEVCEGLAKDDLMTAELLTSEVVTNAVIHPQVDRVAGDASIVLQISCTPGLLRVEVTDQDPEPPHLAGSPPAELEHGWGLRIVSLMATSWGSYPVETGIGKTVWFEMDLASHR